MKQYLIFKLLAYSTVLIAIVAVTFGFENNEISTNNETNSPVLLELFTSQGCSSCPPADVVLSKYALENNPNIITLAFHVDYWNYIGWKDPFSQHQFSERQRDYAERLSSNVYTPQLVINGKHEIIGSETRSIDRIVKQELTQKTDVKINVNSIKLSENQLYITYAVTNANLNSEINFALVHKKVITAVKRGENSGKQLTNYNIVTEFIHQPVKTSEVTIPFNEKLQPSEYAIVAYVQEKENGKILGAVQHEIN